MNNLSPQIDWGQVARRLGASHRPIEPCTTDVAADATRLLARRARALASRRVDAHTADGQTPLITFRLHNLHCGIALNELARVTPMRQCTPVPGAPPSVVGVVNREGDLCSVIDLARLMNVSDEIARDDGHIMHLRRADDRIGLRVDVVDSIVSVDDDALHNANETSGLPNQFVRGLTPSGINVIDIAAVLAHDIFSSTPSHQGA